MNITVFLAFVFWTERWMKAKEVEVPWGLEVPQLWTLSVIQQYLLFHNYL